MKSCFMLDEYVREEMNRADRNAEQEGEGGGAKRRVMGFTLMTLQRRLASSHSQLIDQLNEEESN